MNAEGSFQEMIAVVSHDLKAPLSTIKLAVSYLAEELIPDVEERRLERKNLQIIQRSVERMSRLIDDLLVVNAATSGRFQVNRARLPVDMLLDDVTEILRPLADAKRIELRTECAVASPVFVDRDRMLQVFTNIGTNAIKFTPSGGRVTIRVRRARGIVRFEISDTGPGIAPAHLARVFDRFWQAADTAALGHGLGLDREGHRGGAWRAHWRVEHGRRRQRLVFSPSRRRSSANSRSTSSAFGSPDTATTAVGNAPSALIPATS